MGECSDFPKRHCDVEMPAHPSDSSLKMFPSASASALSCLVWIMCLASAVEEQHYLSLGFSEPSEPFTSYPGMVSEIILDNSVSGEDHMKIVYTSERRKVQYRVVSKLGSTWTSQNYSERELCNTGACRQISTKL